MSETIETLTEELLEWFETTATNLEVIEYVERLPTDRQETYLTLCDELLFNVRFKRTRLLKRCFSGSLVKIIREPDINDFLIDCTQYDTTSVLKNYAVRFPALAEVIVLNSPVEGAESVLTIWGKVLIFRVAKRFTLLHFVFEPLLGLNLQQAEYAALTRATTEFKGTLKEQIVKNNYLPHRLTITETQLLETILGVLSFISDADKEDLHTLDGQQRLVELLENITYCGEVISAGLSAGISNGDIDRFKGLLLTSMIRDEEINLAIPEQLKFDPENQDEYLDNLGAYFIKLFSEKYLLSGVVPGELLKAYGPLDKATKEKFNELLDLFIITSETIAFWLEDLDPESAVINLHSAGSKVAIEETIDGLCRSIRPENQALGRAILEAVAKIYYL